MEVSKVLGVKVGEEFKVRGFSSIFRVVTCDGNREYLETKFAHEDNWREAKLPTVYEILYLAPDNIIHTPQPLTDNQIEHLKALWAIGGQWLAKDASGTIFCYKAKPQKKDGCEWTTWESDEFIDITDFVTSVSGLVSWLDHEPYDIAKALGIKR